MAESVVTSEVDKESMEHPQVAQPLDQIFGKALNADLEEPWYKSIVRSIRESINAPKLPPLVLTSKPLDGADLGDLQKIEQPWFKSLFTNIKELIHPPKLPPLEVTSKPIEVGSIWGGYAGGGKKSGTVSILIHVAVITLLL